MKSHFKLLAILFFCTLSLLILFVSTKLPNAEKNGFNRNFLATKLEILQEKTLEVNVNNICGISKSSIFLTGQTPRAILKMNNALEVEDTLLISLNKPDKKIVPFKLVIDSPKIYLHLNNSKEIIFGQFPGSKLTATKIKSEIFTKSLQISASSMVTRSIDFTFTKQSLNKIDCFSGAILNKNELIKNQTDGGISTDGMLVYDSATSSIIYVQYLANKFFCLDTNLQVKYEGRTIDTISSSPVNTATQYSTTKKGRLSANESRVIVNKMSMAYNKLLFIISGLKSDNERLDEFNQNTTIDIYNIESGNYIASLYIAKRNKQSFKSAVVKEHALIALYENEIVIYQMPDIDFGSIKNG